MADIIRLPDAPIEESAGIPFRKEGLSYVYEPEDQDGILLGLRLRADYIERHGGDVHVELTAESMIPGTLRHIHRGKLNLTASTTKNTLAKHLSHLTEGVAWNWPALLEGFCEGILRSERAGAPFQRVGPRPAPADFRPHYLVAPFVLEDAPTILYGPGSSAKGYLTVGMCCAVAAGVPYAGFLTGQGAVLYLDWEDTHERWSVRCWQVAQGMGLDEPPPQLYYRQCAGPIKGQVNQIAQEIARRHVRLVVIDSVGMACGASGERQSYEDKALELFEAIRCFGPCSCLLIDHVSEEGRKNGQLAGKSYGSVYKFNLIRNQWEARKEQALGSTTLNVGLFNTKSNHSAPHQPVVIRVDFTEQAVTFAQADIGETATLTERLPDHEQMERLLRQNGPMLTAEIALAIGKQTNAVRTVLSRYSRKFQRMGSGKQERIALIQGPESAPQEEIPF